MYWWNLGPWQHFSTCHTLGVSRVKTANNGVPRCSLHTFAQATRGEGPRSERPLTLEGIVHIEFSPDLFSPGWRLQPSFSVDSSIITIIFQPFLNFFRVGYPATSNCPHFLRQKKTPAAAKDREALEQEIHELRLELTQVAGGRGGTPWYCWMVFVNGKIP